MAMTHGQSAALKSVLRLVAAELPQCKSLTELDETLVALQADQPWWPDQVVAEVQKYTAELSIRVPELERTVAAALDTARLRVQPELHQVERSIARLRAARFFLLLWYNKTFRVPPLLRQYEMLKGRPDRETEPQRRALMMMMRNELARLQTDPHAEVTRRLTQRQAALDKILAVRSSPDHAGAQAECDLASLLSRQLPDQFHLFHDVNVETDDWVYDGSEHRRSAQIDHVIVGRGACLRLRLSSGVEHSWPADNHDPFKQVRWAGKLLHLVLSDRLNQRVRVREIIASAGSIPPKPQNSYAKILKPAEVPGFIRWFKPELNDQVLNGVINVLSHLC